MNTTTQASRFIPITNPDLRFMGRIDRTPADHQTWAFPYTQVSFRCTGTSIGVRLVNHWGYGDAYLGAIIDGMQVKARVPIDGAIALVLKMQEKPYEWRVVGNTVVVGSPEKMRRF